MYQCLDAYTNGAEITTNIHYLVLISLALLVAN
jgi:hypothetical protein